MKGNVYLNIDMALSPWLLLLRNKTEYACSVPFFCHSLGEIWVIPLYFSFPTSLSEDILPVYVPTLHQARRPGLGVLMSPPTLCCTVWT